MHVTLVDDLTNKDIPEGEGGPTTFGLAGKNYEIDLAKENQDELHAALEKYIAAARPLRTGSKPSTPSQGRNGTRRRTVLGHSPREIRDWARTNGHEVPDRGRIPKTVQTAFEAAHK